MSDQNSDSLDSMSNLSYPTPIIDTGMDLSGYKNFVDLMDEMEVQVERLRSNVAYLEDEKDGILNALDSIRNSSFLSNQSPDEMVLIERLAARMASVEVRVNIVRDGAQEEALYEVNTFIDRLIVDMEKDVDFARARCLKFINTCGSQENGPIDQAFERALLGCTLDDQKRIQKRLCGLKCYFDKLAVVPLND